LPRALPDDLLNANFVFVRKDGVSKPLDRPYDGPFEVIRRSKDVFQLKMGEKLVNVLTARLKPVISADLIVHSNPPREAAQR
jgi:hypothetical protein